MRICIAQTKPIKGNIEQNLKAHIEFITTAIKNSSDLIIFPELSLSGYEPELARQLATTRTDSRFDALQQLSNKNKITICVGVPTIDADRIFISMIIFQPSEEIITYNIYIRQRKMYLQQDKPQQF